MKVITLNKPSKDIRKKLILFGLVEMYLATGKPIGSDTFRKNGFEALSSATIRNYFAKLEQEGLIRQQHSSGGRIPSPLAFKAYAEAHLQQPRLLPAEKKEIEKLLTRETREVAAYLQDAVETISTLTHCAAFLSAPRFDQDFILDIKVMAIDHSRLLCVIITDFGMIRTEVLHTDKKLSSFSIKRIEAYFHYRLTGIEKPHLDSREETLASYLYKELLLRHIITYTNFSAEDLTKAGFSKLLDYADFNEASALARGLSLFENTPMLHQLLQSTCKNQGLSCWIGEDLAFLSPDATACSVVTIPYRINQSICGAIGILGPHRIPYRTLFGKLEQIAQTISDSLTKSIYKFKITYRNPKQPGILSENQCLLLEDRRTL